MPSMTSISIWSASGAPLRQRRGRWKNLRMSSRSSLDSSRCELVTRQTWRPTRARDLSAAAPVATCPWWSRRRRHCSLHEPQWLHDAQALKQDCTPGRRFEEAAWGVCGASL
jgi:hypothetical protein